MSREEINARIIELMEKLGIIPAAEQSEDRHDSCDKSCKHNRNG